MAKFSFTALLGDGRGTRGMITEESQEAAMKILSDRGFTVTRLVEVKEAPGLFSLGAPRLKPEELLVFTQEIASMLNAGLSLTRALEIVMNDSENPSLRKISTEIAAGVKAGDSLSDQMRLWPSVFSRFYVSMVESGEAAGNLSKILFRLASYIENAENLKSKVIGAVTYPLAVMFFAVLIMVGIFFFGIPKFKEIYDGIGKELPLITRMFLNSGDFLSNNWMIIIVLIVAGAASLYFMSRNESSLYALDRLLLRVWIAGPIVRRLCLARFARAFGTLYSAGVQILQALDLVACASANRVLEENINKAARDVREGKTLAESLRGSEVFTQMSIGMIAAGEEAGTLAVMLDKIADFYEAQVEVALKSLTGIMEPIIMIGVGGLVALVVLVLGLPLFQLATSLG
jgi:type IV pilus assembly protein PilC